jgi:Bacterial aa3 type cytochrome c oxidase subunit IV
MAEHHGTVEYATAAGNDYPTHEKTYESFVEHTFVGIIHIINILLGLAVGGVMGHWFTALAIFIIAVLGAIPGFVSGSKASSYVAFVICFLLFAFTGLGGG